MNFKQRVPGCIWLQTLTLIGVWQLQWRKRSHKSITLNASSSHKLICFLWRSLALIPSLYDSYLHHCWHDYMIFRIVWTLLSMWDINYIYDTVALIHIYGHFVTHKRDWEHCRLTDPGFQLIPCLGYCLRSSSPVLPMLAWVSSAILSHPKHAGRFSYVKLQCVYECVSVCVFGTMQ